MTEKKNKYTVAEAPYIALLKPDLKEQKDFERLWKFYSEMMSHRAINDIRQTIKKEVNF